MLIRCCLFSIIFLSSLAFAQCPGYLQNCQTCTAQVFINGTRTSLAQCTSCIAPANQTFTHLILTNASLVVGMPNTMNCVPCAYNCRSCNTQYDGDCRTSACESEFYESSGQCLPCPLSYCRQCTSTVCTACLDGYYLSSDSSACVPCSTYQYALLCRQNIIISCIDGYYTVNGDICFSCGSMCSQCASNTTCVKCQDGYYAVNGACMKCSDNCLKCKSQTMCVECGAGYYLDGGSITCRQCTIGNCEQCNSTGGCVMCKSLYYLANGNCVSRQGIDNCWYYSSTGCITCADGFYLQAGANSSASCLPCSVTCSSCTGPHFANCKSCKPFARMYGSLCIANRSINTGRQQFLTARNTKNKFVSDVTQTLQFLGSDVVIMGTKIMLTIADVQAWRIVALWKVYVLTANNAAPQYQVVFDNGQPQVTNFTNLTIKILNNSLTNYPHLSTLNFSSISQSNLLYFQSNTSIAISELLLQYSPCGNGCSVCNSLIDCSKCINSTLYRQEGECMRKCIDKYYTFQAEKKCYRTCPNGTYPKDQTVTCEICPVECVTCLTNSSCLSCADGFYLYNRTCLSTCPQRFFPKAKNCDSCLYPCMTCSNSSYCLTCAVNFLSNGSCVSTCPDTFYPDYVGMTCLTCQSNISNCLTCQSLTKCLACSPQYLKLDWSCLTKCPDKYYVSKNETCQRCSYVCRTCDITDSNCTTCATGFLLNFSCLSACPQKTYAEVSTLQCKACADPCITCVNSSIMCTSCKNSTYLLGYQCLQSCPKGFYTSMNGCIRCRLPCLTCSNDTACLSCARGYLTYTSCVFAQQCPEGTYADIPTQNCLPCFSNCKTCKFSPTKCTSCDLSLNLTLDFFSNTCVGNCPAGLFNNGSSQCQSCSSICQTCDLTAQNCTSCVSGQIFQNYTCVGLCTTGFYLSNGKCEKCVNTCSVCVSEKVCVLCAKGFFMSETVVQINQTNTTTVPSCVSVCPNNFYADASTSTCVQCNPPCLQCTNSLQCLSCLTGIFFKKSCVYSCPTNTYNSIQTNSCEECPAICFTCAASGNSSYCTSCKTTTYLSNGTCVQTCPDKTFADIITQRCLACQYPCLHCAGGKDICLSCEAGFLQGNKCVDSCLKGSYGENATCKSCVTPCSSCQSEAFCLSCVTNFYLEMSNNTCVQTCPDQFYGSDGLCLMCLFPCQTCQSSTYCLSCISGTLLNGSCDSQCQIGYYQKSINGGNVCLKCSQSCVTCRLQADYCLECSNSQFVLNGSCYQICPNGTYKNQRMCTKCSGSCILCNSQFKCLGCGYGTYLFNSSCVSYCPNGYFPQDSICSLCSPPCFTCYSQSSCTSCLTDSSTPLYLYQYTCVSSCPSGSFLLPSINLCKQCTFPCKSCHNSTSCISCAYGYLYVGSSCIAGPDCPNQLYLQVDTQTCVPVGQCSNESVINQQERLCGRECTGEYVRSAKKCVDRCNYGEYLTVNRECLLKSEDMSFPQLNVLFVVINSKLQLWLEFDQDMSFGQSSGVTLSIRSPISVSQRRLLLTSTVTPKYLSNNARKIRYYIPFYGTLLDATAELEFSNSFLASTKSQTSNLPLQTISNTTLIPFYQSFENFDSTGTGFQYLGEVLSGVTYAIGLGYLAFNRFSQLYVLVDVLQDLYLIGFLEVLYPPNLRQLLLGFKNSHLYFIPNIFSRLFDDHYRQYSPGKFLQLSTDVNFLRNAAHVYTGLLILASLWGLLRLTQFILSKFIQTKNVRPVYEIIHRARKNFIWSYTTDVVVVFMQIVMFFGFAQMMDYESKIGKASAGISVITLIGLLLYCWYCVRLMKRISKAQDEGIAKFSSFQSQHPNLNCFLSSTNQISKLSPYFLLLLFAKKLLVSLCISTMSSSPLFVFSTLTILSLSLASLTGYYLPFSDRVYNFVIVLAYSSLSLVYVFASAIQFNYDTMETKTKWVLGWLASVCGIVAGFSLFMYVGYRAVTQGYGRKYLEAEEADEGDNDSQPNEQSRQQSTGNKKRKKVNKKVDDEPPDSPTHVDNQLITYEPSGSEQHDGSQPSGMPKLLLKCYKSPFGNT